MTVSRLSKTLRLLTVKIMKRKKKQITLNYNSATSEDFKRLNEILFAGSQLLKADNDLYLLDTDIEKLNRRYSDLFKQVEDDETLPDAQKYNACAILMRKYNFEVNELSNMREKEYLTEQAKINADNAEQIPWRRGWWWRLIFKPLTNRAQDIIERRAELEAQQEFAPIEKELDELDETLFAGTGKKLSKRKRKRLMEKYLKLKCRLISAPAAPPAGYEQTATPANTAAPAPAPPAPTSAAEEHARDAVHHGGNVNENTADNVPEPPEPPARKPRQNKNSGT